MALWVWSEQGQGLGMAELKEEGKRLPWYDQPDNISEMTVQYEGLRNYIKNKPINSEAIKYVLRYLEIPLDIDREERLSKEAVESPFSVYRELENIIYAEETKHIKRQKNQL